MDKLTLTSAWCEERADVLDKTGSFYTRHELDNDARRVTFTAAALRIASRVLDEGAEERLARVIAAGLGDELDHAFVNKGEWNRCRGEKGGRYRDINEPMLDDYLGAARAVLAHIRGAG